MGALEASMRRTCCKWQTLSILNQYIVCVCLARFSPFRWGGPRPICWFMPKGSWGLGFMALVWRAESELVLCGEEWEGMGVEEEEEVNAEWSAPWREEDSSGGWVTSWSAASTADLTSMLQPRLRSQASADLSWLCEACPHMHGYSCERAVLYRASLLDCSEHCYWCSADLSFNCSTWIDFVCW